MVRLSCKCVIWSMAAGAAALVSGGCQTAAPMNQASAPAAAVTPTQASAIRSDVTDIHPPAMVDGANTGLAQTAAYQVAAEDAAPQPITYTSVAAAPTTLVVPRLTTGGAALSTVGGFSGAGNTHLVRHGETLYSIARETYGTGKQWRKIALANPGVTAATLKVGENLIIP